VAIQALFSPLRGPVALHDYLRYHYFIDVLCGFALAAFALWLANRQLPKTMETSTTTNGLLW